MVMIYSTHDDVHQVKLPMFIVRVLVGVMMDTSANFLCS